MEKKQYTRPEVQAYQVNPSEVICSSGSQQESLSTQNDTNTTPTATTNSIWGGKTGIWGN